MCYFPFFLYKNQGIDNPRGLGICKQGLICLEEEQPLEEMIKI